MRNGIITIEVSQSYNKKYELVKKVCAKRFVTNYSKSIIFIDYETDGIVFSHSINKNFNLKNIESFLKLHFKIINQQCDCNAY